MMHTSLYGALTGTDPLAAAAAAAMVDPLLAARDTTFTKIFVGGLPYHTTDKTLQEYFEQFGEIEEAVVITDRQTQKSRGYGFVTMKDRAGAERACKDPNPIIDGRKANVNLAYLGAKPRGNLHLAGLQFPLQSSVPTLLQGARLGLPQLYYPTAASQLVTSPGLMIPPVSPLSPTGAAPTAQYLDYTNAVTSAAYAAQPTGYEQFAYSPTYGLIPAAYANPNAAAMLAAQGVAAQADPTTAARVQ